MNLLELPWLASNSNSFSEKILEVSEDNPDLISTIRSLASLNLDESKLTMLGRKFSHLTHERKLENSTPFATVNVISNANCDFLKYPLIATGLRYGININVNINSFSFSNSNIRNKFPSKQGDSQFHFDLIFLDRRPFVDQQTGAIASADKIYDMFSAIYSIAKSENAGKKHRIIGATLCQPQFSELGHYDRRNPNSIKSTLISANNKIVASLSDNDLLLDIDELASTIGRTQWTDDRIWNHGKVPFALSCIPILCDHISRLLSSAIGKSKKCLVLDLDNTLWGGVIGDDGIDGVIVGSGSPLGESFLDFQRQLLALRSRGVLLAACSKNDEKNVIQLLNVHPEMLINKAHFSAFYCNWDDKPGNLIKIASELNIGLDSLVFFDDSPFERNMVRQLAPEVAVIEVPKDPSLYSETLLNSGWFESFKVLDEDLIRNEQYKQNHQREMLRASISSEDQYLRSLNMHLTAYPIDQTNLDRATQLINKTNQFNLTAKRTTNSELQSESASDQYISRCFRLTDTFGDNGIISVLNAKKLGVNTLTIETWVISCRVFNRGVEHAIFNHLVMIAKDIGIEIIRGQIMPTEKNQSFIGLYSNIGFQAISNDQTLFELNIKDWNPLSTEISIKS
jgi:FkbH-like protein